MPPPPPELFLEAVISTVRANQHYVPPLGRGSLYIRPLLLGTGPILGLGPAPSYTLVVYCAAVGAYFKVAPCQTFFESMKGPQGASTCSRSSCTGSLGHHVKRTVGACN